MDYFSIKIIKNLVTWYQEGPSTESSGRGRPLDYIRQSNLGQRQRQQVDRKAKNKQTLKDHETGKKSQICTREGKQR